MARVFATPADLTEWTGTAAPANAVGLLRSASTLISRETRTAIYPTDYAGLPLGVAAVTFKDATTAQAAYWAANNLDPATGSLAEQGKRTAISKSIGGGSIAYDAADAAQAKAARVQALDSLCREAWTILDEANLVNQPPVGY